MHRLLLTISAPLLMAFGGCNAETPEAMAGAAAGETKREASIMKLTSPAFGDGGTIPARYTCDGGDVIPPLVFTNVPHEAKTLALVVDDPDAPVGTWDHWVVWNIPATTAGVEEGKPPTGVVGRNSWKKNSWGGPCPPDREHRYFFRLYALDATLDLARDATKAELERAMDDHLLAETELMARYERRRR